MATEIACFLNIGPCINLEESLKRAQDVGFSGIVTSASHPGLKSHRLVGNPQEDKWVSNLRTESALSDMEDWGSVMLETSALHGLNSSNEEVAAETKRQLLSEVAAATYVPCYGVVLRIREMPSEKILDFFQFLLTEALPPNAGTKVVLSFPYCDLANQRRQLKNSDGDTPVKKVSDPWQWWDAIRARVGDDQLAQRKVVVNLQIPSELPSIADADAAVLRKRLTRWSSDSVVFFSMPNHVFISKPRGGGFALTQRHENLVGHWFASGVTPILEGRAGQEAEEGFKLECLKAIVDLACLPRNLLNSRTSVDSSEVRFIDYPRQYIADQRPLEVLVSDVMSAKKTDLYKRAISRALSLLKRGRNVRKKLLLNVVLVGLRHYELIDHVVEAAKAQRETVLVQVLEPHLHTQILRKVQYEGVKNPYATVKVHYTKPGDWKPEGQIDLLISDAIGPFGDDAGLEYHLRPLEPYLAADGVVIPTSVAMVIAPIQSAATYREVAVVNLPVGLHPDTCWNVPWAAQPMSQCVLSEPLKAITLKFPITRKETDAYRCNEYRQTVQAVFEAKQSLHVHGILGCFEADLCDGILFRNYSPRKDGRVELWPGDTVCFLPLKKPFTVKANEVVEVEIGKELTCKAIWHEWRMTLVEKHWMSTVGRTIVTCDRGCGDGPLVYTEAHAIAVSENGSGDGRAVGKGVKTIAVSKNGAGDGPGIGKVSNGIKSAAKGGHGEWHNGDGEFYKFRSYEALRALF